MWMWGEQWEEIALSHCSLLLHDLQQVKELIKLILYDTREDVLRHAYYGSIEKLQLEAFECLVLMHSIKLRLDWTAYRIVKGKCWKCIKGIEKSLELQKMYEEEEKKDVYRNMKAIEGLKLTLQSLHDLLNEALNFTSLISKIEIGDYQKVKEQLDIIQKALTEISNYLERSFA
jgi:hypothetical protein